MTGARKLSSAPSLAVLYPKALVASARPALRRLPPPIGAGRSPAATLPEIELSLPDLEVARENLSAYDRLCGFTLRDELPATYLHLVAFPLSMEVMTDPAFPFPVIGLVHIRNRIERLRPVHCDERPTLTVGADSLAPHERGTQFDIVAEATAAGEPVWRSRSTYLRRGGAPREDGGKRPSADTSPPDPAAVWHVPGDVGRRYAAVSGDGNPIHIHRVSARLFGMPRAIAHGMWLKARCLAALESVTPPSHVAEVQFKQPVLLPARLGFASWPEAGGRGFRVDGRASRRPHLSGTVEPLGG